MCRANLKGFAPHIHVLYREVPHILCITQPPANCASLEEALIDLLCDTEKPFKRVTLPWA